MECILHNRDALTRFKGLVNQYYKELVHGIFDSVTATILNDIDVGTDEETVATGDEAVAADNTN